MTATIKTITRENLDTALLGSRGLVIADFWAEWCGPCRAFAPAFAQAADSFAGKIAFAKVNIEEFPQAAELLQVASIPTSVIFKDGKEIRRIVGAVSKENLEKQIAEIVSKN